MAKGNDAARERNALRRRRKLRQVLGAAVCVLVVMGAFSAVNMGINLVKKAFDDTEERLAYEQRLLYLVALDPVPFDNLAEANKTTLLTAAIWDTIAQSGSDSFEHDEVGAMYLPTIDIDKTVAKLYGPEFKFEHKTFEDRSLVYTYVEEKQAYLIPITSAISDYRPQVAKIKREGDTRRVTVGYLSQNGTGGEFIVGGDSKPVKYYDYIFTKMDGGYFLSAIVDSEMKAESSTSTNSSAQNAVSVDPQDALQQQVLPEIATESTSASENAPTA